MSRWEYQSTSAPPDSTRTIGFCDCCCAGSTRVGPVSVTSVRTSPVAGSIRSRVSVRTSRDWRRKWTAEPSSSQQAHRVVIGDMSGMLSGSVRARTVSPVAMSSTTSSPVGIRSSPGYAYR